MGQLGRLQARYEDFKRLDVEIVSVLREEQLGAEGIRRAQEESGAEFLILNDPEGEQTRAYSQQSYSTYVIDSAGVIRAILKGRLYKRPTVEETLEAVRAMTKPSSVPPSVAGGNR